MKNMKLVGHSYADIPAGTKLIIPNPKWDGDKPKTQFYLEIETTGVVCVEIQGSYPVTVLGKN
jgi:hypothetical protein